MAEHGSDGVWHKDGGAADSADLPISEALRKRLAVWNFEYGKTIDPILTQRMGHEPFDVVSFSAEGMEVAKAIKAEAPEWTVEYFDQSTDAWLTVGFTQMSWEDDLTNMQSILAAEYLRDPGFLKRLCDTIRQHRMLRQAAALKNYLFVSAPGETVGANGNVSGFRLRSAEERYVALAALDVGGNKVGTIGKSVCGTRLMLPALGA